MSENTVLIIVFAIVVAIFVILGWRTLNLNKSYILNKIFSIFYFGIAINFVFNIAMKFAPDNIPLFVFFVRMCLIFTIIGWMALVFSMIIITKGEHEFRKMHGTKVYVITILVLSAIFFFWPNAIIYVPTLDAHPYYSQTFGIFIISVATVTAGYVLFITAKLLIKSESNRKNLLEFEFALVFFSMAMILSPLGNMHVLPYSIFNLISILILGGALLLFHAFGNKSEKK
ncbi:MAG: hypothetical protein ACTSU2_05025 [Promethearchaeota archaeon]